jgi:hypothetical protein
MVEVARKYLLSDSADMSNTRSWRDAYGRAQRELDPVVQLQLCEQTRRLIHDRLVKLGQGSLASTREREELEAALRAVWALEQSIRKPDVH